MSEFFDKITRIGGEGISKRSALEYCDAIGNAAELADLSNKLARSAQRAANLVTRETVIRPLPFRLRVAIAEEQETLVVNDGVIVDSQPSEFIATGVYSIGPHGVEFIDHETSNRLVIQGFDFEVTPVFDEPGPV